MLIGQYRVKDIFGAHWKFIETLQQILVLVEVMSKILIRRIDL